MENKKSQFFSVLCVGDAPEELMKQYDLNAKCEPYVKYKFLDAEKYKNTAVKIQEQLVENFDKLGLEESLKEVLAERIRAIKTMSTFDYYRELTEGMYYDTNGNALCDINPLGKWKTCSIGKHFALPFKTLDGAETYSALKRDIDWSEMHLANQGVYAAAWETVVEGRAPDTKEELTVYNAMKDRLKYFSNFKTKEDYVAYSTSYWNYAYVDEQQGWVDMEGKDNMEWINTFFERFITPLGEDVKLTVFECTITVSSF